MKKKVSSSPKRTRRPKAGMVIGSKRFAKISAVEGIVLTGRMKSRIAEFDRTGVSAEERRRTIIRSYSKG